MFRDEARFARALAGAFAVLSLAKTFTHEPWRDEWGPWGLALASRGVAEFWDSLRYGGHPRLWHLAVYALQKTTGAFESVQVLAALLAAVAVWVVARFAPFPRWAKVLFALGYYPLFEYASIARPYAIALPAACVAAALFARSRRDPLPFAVALAVLTQTTVFGVILAAAFALAWLVDQLSCAREERSRMPGALAAAALVGGAAIFAVRQMVPPPDSNFAPGWHTAVDGNRIVQVLGCIVRGIAPLPRPRLHFWNTHLLDGHDGVAAAAGVVTVIALAASLAGRRSATVLWLTAVCGQLAFAYIKFDGDTRHHGYIFLAFLAAAWIATVSANEASSADPPRRRLDLAVAVVFVVNAAAGIFAAAMDAALPFSSAREAAATIRRQGLAELPIVGTRGSTAAAVASALGRPIALAGTGRSSTFVMWDSSYRVPTREELLVQVRSLAVATDSPVLLVQDHVLAPQPGDVKEVATMGETVVADERFFLYLFPRGADPSAASAAGDQALR